MIRLQEIPFDYADPFPCLTIELLRAEYEHGWRPLRVLLSSPAYEATKKAFEDKFGTDVLLLQNLDFMGVHLIEDKSMPAEIAFSVQGREHKFAVLARLEE